MDTPYPLMPLGDVLTKSEEWTELQPDRLYRQVTVRLWGQGVVQRNEVSGAEIAATKRLSRDGSSLSCRASMLVMAPLASSQIRLMALLSATTSRRSR